MAVFTDDNPTAVMVPISLVPGTAGALRDTDGSVGGVAGNLLVPMLECTNPNAYYK